MTEQGRKFLLFRVGNSKYALYLDQVSEVCDSQTIWPIPLAPPCFSGAFNFHGNAVAVLDLFALMDLGAQASAAEKLVVVHHETASFACIVEDVIAIIPEAEVTPHPHPDSPFAAALLDTALGDVTLLSLDTILHYAENKITSIAFS